MKKLTLIIAALALSACAGTCGSDGCSIEGKTTARIAAPFDMTGLGQANEIGKVPGVRANPGRPAIHPKWWFPVDITGASDGT